MITEDYVSFEVAKLLKEKGFDEYCFTAYSKEVGDFITIGPIKNSDITKEDKHIVTAPTLQMAMKWLRKLYCVHFNLEPALYKGIVIYNVTIYKQAKNHKVLFDGELEVIYYQESSNLTYEQACEEAIKYCLENLI